MLVLSLSILIVLSLSKETLINNSNQINPNRTQQLLKPDSITDCTLFTLPERISIKFSQQIQQKHYVTLAKINKTQSICRQCFPYICIQETNNQKIISKCSKFIKNYQAPKIQQFAEQQIYHQFAGKIMSNHAKQSTESQNRKNLCTSIEIIWEQKDFQNEKQHFLEKIFLLQIDQAQKDDLMLNFALPSANLNTIFNSTQFRRILLSQQTENVTNSYQNFINCQTSCRECDGQGKCINCRAGFQINNRQICQPTKYFYFTSIVMSFALNTFGFSLLFQTFINQFAFYEYHALPFSRLKNIFQFVGSVNRQKYIPLFFRALFPEILANFDKNLVQIIPEAKYIYSEGNFLKYEKIPIHFISNTYKIVIWNFFIIISIFSAIKFTNTIAKKYQKSYNFLERNSSCQFIFVLVFQSQTQYYIFMFCKQVWNSFSISFGDKSNFIFSIILSFFIIIFALGGYSIFCFMSPEKNLQLFYPNVKKHHTFQAFLHKFVDAQGRYLLIGAIQAIEQHCAIKMFLLCLINLSSMIFCYKLNIEPSSIYKFLSRNLFSLIQFIFCLFGLMSHLEIGRYVQFHSNIQFLCILLLWMVIGMELLCYLLKGIEYFVSLCIHYWEEWTKVSPVEQYPIKIRVKFDLKLKTSRFKLGSTV